MRARSWCQLPSASPHTRGWTPCAAGRVPGASGFPAHAGMDPPDAALPPLAPGLPRTRGDGPLLTGPLPTPSTASPHTRGWTRARSRCARAAGGFPAHAGMDPGLLRRQPSRRRLPRTRGDGPQPRSVDAPRTTASPHTRGWTPRHRRVAVAVVGFPAHAGMDPAPRPLRLRRGRLPRTRGDGPCAPALCARIYLASPHTRGWTLATRWLRRSRRGFPAHAGMDPRGRTTWCRPRRLPRTRGDGPSLRRRGRHFRRASPHTRGWTRHVRLRHDLGRGFPAHAGMDPP